MTALAKEAEPQSAYAVLEGQVRQFAAKLGFADRGGGAGLDAVSARGMSTISHCMRRCGV